MPSEYDISDEEYEAYLKKNYKPPPTEEEIKRKKAELEKALHNGRIASLVGRGAEG